MTKDIVKMLGGAAYASLWWSRSLWLQHEGSAVFCSIILCLSTIALIGFIVYKTYECFDNDI